jgi:hypothetical protein
MNSKQSLTCVTVELSTQRIVQVKRFIIFSTVLVSLLVFIGLCVSLPVVYWWIAVLQCVIFIGFGIVVEFIFVRMIFLTDIQINEDGIFYKNMVWAAPRTLKWNKNVFCGYVRLPSLGRMACIICLDDLGMFLVLPPVSCVANIDEVDTFIGSLDIGGDILDHLKIWLVYDKH